VGNCPVCDKAGVDEDAIRCPQCDADLECFALLDALQETAPEPTPQADWEEVKEAIDSLQEALGRGVASRRTPRWGWLLLAAAAALAVPILVVQIPTIGRRLAEPPAPVREPDAAIVALQAVAGGVERLTKRLGAVEGRLDTLTAEQAKTFEQAAAGAERVAELARGRYKGTARPSAATKQVAPQPATSRVAAPDKKAPELILYHRRPGETLWSIAKRYYGKGQLYPALIAQNPGVGIYHDGDGVLRIFADPAEAVELYRRITPPGAEGRLFRYRVQPGDDWRELARRFLGRASRAPELIALNTTSELIPGEQVLIALE
jgi:nucleoid-associated protein YgaU